VDVTDAEGGASAIAVTEAEYVPVGCLVNNAAIMLLGQADAQDCAEQWS
jgi:NADP-dependent 3-hydroxy acid dehydrogenase YdfG